MNYNEKMPTCMVNVLGTPYSIYADVPMNEDPLLADGISGYCDNTARRIVITAEPLGSEIADWTVHYKETLRHEIIHAFLYESGIDGNCTFDVEGEEHPEHLVAWMSIQFPKMLKAFGEVGAI